jgi:nitrate reductase delta subunit
MLRSPRIDKARLECSERIQDWTRARYGLDKAAIVMVTEIRCGMPGCPPLETVIAFWDEAGELTRYRYKVFKPIAEVVEDDLPPRWYKVAMIDDGSSDGCC